MRRTTTILLAALLLFAACGRSPRKVALTSPTPEATIEASADATPIESASPGAGSPAPATPGRSPTAKPTAAPAPPPPPPAAAGPRLKDVGIKLVKVADTNGGPVAIDNLDASTVYMAEKDGLVHVLKNGQIDNAPVLDISGEVSGATEQGLLGLAFSPDRQFVYVYFTNKSGDIRVREYAIRSGKPDTGSGRDVLAIGHPNFANHNGGQLAFGPDGKLYIGVGDGGSGGDPLNHGQSLNTLLGKILRIEPRPSGGNQYGIPPDNPFVSTAGARGEIWAFGLRNPWRFSFDRATGDMWIGDVGQDSWEEIDFQPRSSHGGENYGWRLTEGSHGYNGGSPPSGWVAPVYDYSHDEGCSITGGYVYRGAKIPAMQGAYLFIDFCAGRLRAVAPGGAKVADHRFLGPQLANASAFGQDTSGELYVMSLDGGLYRIDPT